jgi:signal transduction histidine kinase
LLRDDATPESHERVNAQRIIDASERAHGLITRMQTFARQAPVALHSVDAVAAFKEELERVRAAVPNTVEITFAGALVPAYLMATPPQIHQMVMNLCLNASQAMNGQGALGIEIGQSVLRLHGGAPKHCLSLIVTDTGCGMSAELRKRVLEPFFTTHAPGKGAGLGLSVVFGIVSELGGEMHIQSEVGVGTRFSIDLPLLEWNAPPAMG